MSKHSRSTSDEPIMWQMKKFKGADIDNRPLLDAADSIKTFHPALQSAYMINTALSSMFDVGSKVPQLGVIVSYLEHQKPPTQAQKQVLDKLASVKMPGVKALRPYAFGIFGPATFKSTLKVTRPDCEFNGRFSQLNRDVLQSWLQNATISGYRGIADLHPEVDTNVRNGREIGADEFAVEPKLLDEIAKIWKGKFIPGDVRVEPHKILIYGEGGHFSAHCDAPEQGMVGIFLVGLYDSTKASSLGNFHIEGKCWHATGGRWVAFHPDVPHEVTPLAPGCARAVIAFKLFSTEDPNEAATCVAAEVEEAKSVLRGIPRPFGIILSHKYSAGTEDELDGYDAVMLSAARQIEGSGVRVIPVVTRLLEEQYYDEEDSLTRNCLSTEVKPFTQAHMDLQLGREIKSECTWFEWFKDVPFYSWDLRNSATRWQHREEEIGNEANGKRRDTLYLSYAIMVVPGKLRRHQEIVPCHVAACQCVVVYQVDYVGCVVCIKGVADIEHHYAYVCNYINHER